MHALVSLAVAGLFFERDTRVSDGGVGFITVPVHDELDSDDGIEDGCERKAPEEQLVVRLGEGGEDTSDCTQQLRKHDDRRQLSRRFATVQFEHLRHFGYERDGDRARLQQRQQARRTQTRREEEEREQHHRRAGDDERQGPIGGGPQ